MLFGVLGAASAPVAAAVRELGHQCRLGWCKCLSGSLHVLSSPMRSSGLLSASALATSGRIRCVFFVQEKRVAFRPNAYSPRQSLHIFLFAFVMTREKEFLVSWPVQCSLTLTRTVEDNTVVHTQPLPVDGEISPLPPCQSRCGLFCHRRIAMDWGNACLTPQSLHGVEHTTCGEGCGGGP